MLNWFLPTDTPKIRTVFVARFIIAPQDMPKAWQWIYGTWFPSSGYLPDDARPFEQYIEMPEDGMITVDNCVSVKALY